MLDAFVAKEIINRLWVLHIHLRQSCHLELLEVKGSF